MIPIILATGAIQSACSFGGINQNDWVGINLLVVLLAIMVSVLIYTIAIVLPTATREKLRGAAKTEAVQGVVALVIVMLLIFFAVGTCSIGQDLTSGLTSGAYQNPMQFSQEYLGNLLFLRSGQLFGQMYAASVLYLVYGNVIEQIVDSVEIPVGEYFSLDPNANVVGVYFGYTGVITGTYTALLVAAFGVLFVFFLILPIVQALALTVLAPLALVMRSLPFGGPRLRESADAFLAIAIAFYFILPLTITMNNSIVNWLYCTNSVATNTPIALPPNTDCNPYSSYLASSTNPLSSLQVNQMFANTPGQSITAAGGSFQFNFFAGTAGASGGIFAIFQKAFSNLFALPYVITGFGTEVAEYLFESLVLIALDIAITVGFAQGLQKGIGAVNGAIGAGPFWGNV